MKRDPSKLKPTAFAGVFEVVGQKGRYQVRKKFTNEKTGKRDEVDRAIAAKSPADADRELQRLVLARQEKHAPPDQIRWSTYAAIWLERKSRTIAPGTRDRYARTLMRYLVGRPAGKDGPAIKAHPLASFYVDKTSQGDVVDWRDGLPGIETTVNSIFAVVKTMMADAAAEYRLPCSPAERITKLEEAPSHSEDDPNLLTAEQLSELLAAVQRVAPQWHAIFSAMACTGMRPGEASVLRWEDVREHDARRGPHLLVRRSQSRRHVRETTKTNKWRYPPLHPLLRDALRAHRRAQLTAQGQGSVSSQMNALRRAESGWCFPTRDGRSPVAPQTVRNALLDIQARLEREMAGDDSPILRLTPKGLRRTFNDLTRQVAEKQIVQDIMGHSDERMTERYSVVRGAERTLAVTRALSAVRDRGGNPGGAPTV
jgi:integrase